MKKAQIAFSNATTEFYFDAKFSQLKNIADRKQTVIITDSNVFRLQKKIFSGWHTIVIKPGEKYKVQSTVDDIVKRMIALEVDRNWLIVGVGGGVVTDLTGYVASIFMRGVKFGFVPTSLLAMVDASIGGKNGIDVGLYKNMVGTIRQPGFILYDEKLLNTLPLKEWRNGFAEIIKHACIMDRAMFRELMSNNLDYYRTHRGALSRLVMRNAKLKIKVVKADEFEKGDRKLLNFGHTLGHAIENEYKLMHGEAVAVGMVTAAKISNQISGFDEAELIEKAIRKYDLPTGMKYDVNRVFKLIISDKKRAGADINFILLTTIGKATVAKIPIKRLRKLIGDL